MKTLRVFCFAAVLALLICAGAFAKGGRGVSNEKGLPLSALEGNWRVASTTWDGGQNGYPAGNRYSPLNNMVFEGLVLNISVVSKGGAAAVDNSTETQFIVTLVPPYLKPDEVEVVPFCAERHPNSPNSYTLYSEYPRPWFWRLEEYPCAPADETSFYAENPDTDMLELTMGGYLVRIDVKDESHAHAIIVYSQTELIAANEGDWEKKMGDIPSKCAKGMCYARSTGSTGIAELELVKIKKGK